MQTLNVLKVGLEDYMTLEIAEIRAITSKL